MEREAKSLQNVHRLQREHDTVRKVHRFLFTKHSMYACCDINADGKDKSETMDLEQAKKLMAAYGFKAEK